MKSKATCCQAHVDSTRARGRPEGPPPPSNQLVFDQETQPRQQVTRRVSLAFLGLLSRQFLGWSPAGPWVRSPTPPFDRGCRRFSGSPLPGATWVQPTRQSLGWSPTGPAARLRPVLRRGRTGPFDYAAGPGCGLLGQFRDLPRSAGPSDGAGQFYVMVGRSLLFSQLAHAARQFRHLPRCAGSAARLRPVLRRGRTRPFDNAAGPGCELVGQFIDLPRSAGSSDGTGQFYVMVGRGLSGNAACLDCELPA